MHAESNNEPIRIPPEGLQLNAGTPVLTVHASEQEFSESILSAFAGQPSAHTPENAANPAPLLIIILYPAENYLPEAWTPTILHSVEDFVRDATTGTPHTHNPADGTATDQELP